MIGRPPISSCSFAKATSEPENEIAPITSESAIAIVSASAARPGSGAMRWYSASAISAAPPPPTPLNSATICGIAVIFTARAETRPIAPPTTIATAIAP